MFFLVPIHLLTMADLFALIAIYVVILTNIDGIERREKILWGIGFFCANMAVMPFWYLHIWRRRDETDGRHSLFRQ